MTKKKDLKTEVQESNLTKTLKFYTELLWQVKVSVNFFLTGSFDLDFFSQGREPLKISLSKQEHVEVLCWQIKTVS